MVRPMAPALLQLVGIQTCMGLKPANLVTHLCMVVFHFITRAMFHIFPQVMELKEGLKDKKMLSILLDQPSSKLAVE